MSDPREPPSRVETYPEADVPPALRAQVAAMRHQEWPGPGSAPPGPVHDPLLDPVSMLLVADGAVLAALDILTKPIVHAGARHLARGLSTVVTARPHRGRGHGTRLVATARAAIRSSGADLGIFTCDPPLQGFYEGAGWQRLPGAVLVGGAPGRPLPSDALGKIVMGSFFSAQACRHADAFIGSRIALFPGNIDKLW